MISKAPGASPQQTTSSQRPAAGAQGIELVVVRFLRALQVLLKSAQLYDRNHPRLLESLEAAERNLRAALPLASPLGISIAGDTVQWRGRPLADPRGELRALASALAKQGVSTLIFLPATNVGELGNLAELLDPSRNQASVAESRNWAALLEQRRVRGIRINAPLDEKKADAVLTRLLAAVLDPSVPLWTRPDPDSSGSDDASAPVIANTSGELRGALQLLGKVAQPLRESYRQAGATGNPAESERAIQTLRSVFAAANPRVLRILVKAMAQQAPQQGEALDPYVARLGENLVLEFAHRQFCTAAGPEVNGNGRARPSEWRGFFIVVAREFLDGGFTPACDPQDLPIESARWSEESCAEHLYERFWEEVPAQQKSTVLRSRDAWCMPVPCLRAYLEQLAGGDSEAPRREARFILLNYARCLESDQLPTRLAVATGLSELHHLIESLWPEQISEELSRCVLRALVQDSAPEVAGVLTAVTSNLAGLAMRLADWAGFERIVDALDACPRDTEHAHLTALAERLLEGERWQTLVEAALANRPLDASLPRIVGRQPERLLDHLGARLAGPRGLEALPAISRLIRSVGEPAIGALVTRLFDPRTARASAAVKMLVGTRPERLVEALPRALPSWDWNVQDLAVGELMRLGTPGTAQAFLAVLPQAHALVVPISL